MNNSTFFPRLKTNAEMGRKMDERTRLIAMIKKLHAHLHFAKEHLAPDSPTQLMLERAEREARELLRELGEIE